MDTQFRQIFALGVLAISFSYSGSALSQGSQVPHEISSRFPSTMDAIESADRQVWDNISYEPSYDAQFTTINNNFQTISADLSQVETNTLEQAKEYADDLKDDTLIEAEDMARLLAQIEASNAFENGKDYTDDRIDGLQLSGGNGGGGDSTVVVPSSTLLWQGDDWAFRNSCPNRTNDILGKRRTWCAYNLSTGTGVDKHYESIRLTGNYSNDNEYINGPFTIDNPLSHSCADTVYTPPGRWTQESVVVRCVGTEDFIIYFSLDSDWASDYTNMALSKMELINPI